jgi:hypothetical protein
MTEWQARRAADRLLCGRQVDGRYVCQGEIATVSSRRGREYASLPLGLYAEPGTAPTYWRPTARFARTRKPTVAHNYLLAGARTTFYSAPVLPLARACPHCGARNLVDRKPSGLL